MGTPKGTKPWNAGTSTGWTDKRGYRWLYVNENGRRRARREHRVVMEQHLGRKLEPWELVHHKDGERSNNSLENLELMEFGAHTAEHNLGSRKTWETRRTLEAFALLREELRAERAVKADLLEALKELQGAIGGFMLNRGEKREHWERRLKNDVAEMVRAAISKATGDA